MFRSIVCLLSLLFLSACAVDRTYGASSDIEITDLTELPKPTEGLSYTIGPREKIEITVLGAEEMSGVYLTDGAGNVAFPYLGTVAIGGEPADEAANLIADGLRGRFVRNPQVRVVPEEITPPSVSVGGEVVKPGAYPVFENDSLLRALNLAEGLSETADNEDVLIIREVDGQRYIGLYNLKAIQRGNYGDPPIFAGDIILVGESAARRRLATILPFIPLASTAAIVIDRLAR